MTGDRGPTGVTGAIGPTGVTGAQGETGIQGATGETGTQGPTGVQGAIGPTGVTGAQGETGIQGVTGLQGIPGTAASQGATGETGTQGETGVQGATGETGTQGETGIQGATGETGTQGPTGVQGATGETGTQGETGVQGATGVIGTTGDQGAIGPTGMQGATGITGVQGETGVVGATGVTGALGPTGVQGATGVTGTQGATGETGIYGPALFSLVNNDPTNLTLTANSVYKSSGSSSSNANIIEVYPYNAVFLTFIIPSLPSSGKEITCVLTNNGTSYQYGFDFDSTDFFYWYNNTGVPTSIGTYNAGDVFTIAVTANGAYWYKNGVLVLSRPLATNTDSLYGFFAMDQSGLSVSNISFGYLDTGIQGNTGAQGATGVTGSIGPQGATGVIGSTGDEGHTGVTGTQGATGVQGPTGVHGTTGTIGATGVTGPPGPAGVTGVQGLNPFNWKGSTGPLIGLTGYAASAGATGGVLIQQTTITLTQTSYIWSLANCEFSNGDPGPNDLTVYVYLIVDGTTSSTTSANIPKRIDSSSPSFGSIGINQITSSSKSAGASYPIQVYAYTVPAGTAINSTHTDLFVLGNLSISP